MKKIFSFILVACALAGHAQDFITKKDGDRIKVKVLEIDGQNVSYKQFDNPDGPVYKLPKSTVLRIDYQNGTYETFPGKQPGNVTNPAIDFTNPNIIALDFAAPVFGEFRVSYERIMANGYVGIKLPLIFGFNSVSIDDAEVRNKAVTGLDFNIYPTGQGRVRYFVGPAFRFGRVKLNDTYYVYDPNNYITTTYRETSDHNMVGFQINNGIMFQQSRSFTISMVLGIGIRNLSSYTSHDYYNDFPGPYATFSANVAYRF